MKIGIITFQNADNYGALLQCYALYKYLSVQGHDVSVINYDNPVIRKSYLGLPRFQKNIFEWSKKAIDRFNNRISIRERHSRFEEFRELINFSEKKTRRQLLKGLPEYDVLIAGSDQIWNPSITKGLDPIYFIDIPGTFFRCAYAVSLGNISQVDYQINDFGRYLNKFDKLSFREKDACELIAKKLGFASEPTIDPTFLLKKNEWIDIATKGEKRVDEPYLLLYYLDNNPELTLIAKDIAKRKKIKIVCCNKTFKNDEDIIWISTIGPQDFLRLIFEAEVIITSSFHATVFSVIFEKEFYTTLHKVTGSRVQNLLQTCGRVQLIFENYADYQERYVKNNGSLNIPDNSKSGLSELIEYSCQYLSFFE